MEKNIHKLWAEFAYLCIWERKKINSFEITVTIFKAYQKCKASI